jgi:hypothetical protein
MNKHIRHAMQEFIKTEMTDSVISVETKAFYAFKHLFESQKMCMKWIEEVATEALAPYNLATFRSFEDIDDADRYHSLAHYYGIAHEWPEEHGKICDEMDEELQGWEEALTERGEYQETAWEDYVRTEMQALR